MGHRKGFFQRAFREWTIAEYITYMRRTHPEVPNRDITGRWVMTLARIAKCSKCCSPRVRTRAFELLNAYRRKVRTISIIPADLEDLYVRSTSSKRPLCSLWAGRVGVALNGRNNDLFARCIV
jgi:hypothetical protein